MRALRAFVRLSRPHFLVGGMIGFGLGAATVGSIRPIGYAVGQVMVSATQLTAHYVNEFYDVGSDRSVTNRTWFSGGSGVLVDGVLTPGVALRAAQVTTLAGIASAATLIPISPAAASIGMVGLAVSWAYSRPPYRLVASGWGELAASVVVAGLVPVVGALSQSAGLTVELWWAIAILLPLHMMMMLAFELPDLHSDAGAGKQVLAVRVGSVATRRLMTLLLTGALVIGLGAWLSDGLPHQALVLGAVGAPLGAATLRLARGDRFSALTTAGVTTFALTALGLLIGLA